MGEIDTELDSESGYLRELKSFLPVGDIICRCDPELRRIKIGYVPREHVQEFVKLCAPWEQNGFKLYLGGRDVVPNSLILNSYAPEVLADDYDTGLATTCYPQSAKPLIGDVRAFFLLTDPVKSYAYLANHTDIPCAVMYEYPCDANTESVVDLANTYFAHYWEFGEAKRLTALSEAEIIAEMTKDL